MKMQLEKLKLVNFKNYESLTLDFVVGLNYFVGLNGMGKTNLLDAIYYLCMSKSNFIASDRNIVRHQESFFRVEGHFIRKSKIEKVVAKVIPGKQKELSRNDVPYLKLIDHIGRFPVVIIVPDDTSLVNEGSEVRRRFVDNTLCQLDQSYLTQLMQYNKILKQRNAALKQFAQTRQFNTSLILSYNEQLQAPAKYIHERRTAFAEMFSPIFNRYYGMIAKDREKVTCTYQSKLTETDFKDLLEESAEKDRILQRTTTGIHKDDLRFRINDFALKQFASQGQMKSFVLALKLAQYELMQKQKNVQPILLLDDIFDKLDHLRVRALMALLADHDFGQVFITDTDENRLEEIVAQFDIACRKFYIEEGAVKAIQ
ncbi:MAG: DNA replication/repair protein RecF [Saprospiraceae bacterium]